MEQVRKEYVRPQVHRLGSIRDMQIEAGHRAWLEAAIELSREAENARN